MHVPLPANPQVRTQPEGLHATLTADPQVARGVPDRSRSTNPQVPGWGLAEFSRNANCFPFDFSKFDTPPTPSWVSEWMRTDPQVLPAFPTTWVACLRKALGSLHAPWASPASPVHSPMAGARDWWGQPGADPTSTKRPAPAIQKTPSSKPTPVRPRTFRSWAANPQAPQLCKPSGPSSQLCKPSGPPSQVCKPSGWQKDTEEGQKSLSVFWPRRTGAKRHFDFFRPAVGCPSSPNSKFGLF